MTTLDVKHTWNFSTIINTGTVNFRHLKRGKSSFLNRGRLARKLFSLGDLRNAGGPSGFRTRGDFFVGFRNGLGVGVD
jgi:hypothetical protein